MQIKHLAAALLASTLSIGALAAEKANEVSFFINSSNTKPEGGDSTTMSLVNLSYGRYLTDQLAVTFNYTGISSDSGGETMTMTQFGIGGKYNFMVGKKGDFVPFVEGQASFGSLDAAGETIDTTGLMLGVGASYHISETTTADVRYQMHKLSAKVSGETYDVDTNMIVVGLTQRF